MSNLSFRPPAAIAISADYLARSFGASFASYVDTSAALKTLVTPAANVNGLVIRSAGIVMSGGSCSLFADTAAPSSAGDTAKRALLGARSTSALLPYQVYVPPGYGLYLWPDSATNRLNVTWDLL
jgi:hypothetical protein